MIRINVEHIKNWEYIKDCHKKYFDKYVIEKMEKINLNRCTMEKNYQSNLY